MEFNQLRYLFEIELEQHPPTTETFEQYLDNVGLQHGASPRLTACQRSELREAFTQRLILASMKRSAP